MSVSKLIYNKNNVKLKDLVPLKEFKTQEDLANMIDLSLTTIQRESNNESLNLLSPEKEFIETNDWLNVDFNKVYFNTKTYMLTNAVIYLDLDKFIVMDLTKYLIFGKENSMLPPNGIRELVQELEEEYYNKHYFSLFIPTPEAFRLELLERLINSVEVVDDELYELFMDFYKTTDFGFDSLKKETMIKLFNDKSEKLKSETNERLSKLPDKVIVHRGQADKSTEYTQAYSWTLNPQIATLFSLRLIEETGKIVTGVVDKNDIMEYFDNEESEVLILPGKVQNIKEYNFYNMNELFNENESVFEMFWSFKYALNSYLNFEDDDSKKRKKHTLRVLLNSLLLGNLNDLCEKDLATLSLSSLYHDISKTDNSIDNSYRIKSCEIFKNSLDEVFEYCEYDFDKDIVEFLIQNHSIEDSIALENLSISNIKDKVKAKELLFILKDANTLDKLRFGIKELNFACLRNEEAIKMIMFAHFSIKHLEL